MRVAVTGHQELSDDAAWGWVRQQIDDFLTELGSAVVAVSSLAAGADQLFARCVLESGGTLHAVIPFSDYRSRFDSAEKQQAFDELLGRSAQVTTLDGKGSDEQRYMEAGRKVVDLADAVLAVWDGQEARGLGGTADVVAYAIRQGVPVRHIDPENRSVRDLRN